MFLRQNSGVAHKLYLGYYDGVSVNDLWYYDGTLSINTWYYLAISINNTNKLNNIY